MGIRYSVRSTYSPYWIRHLPQCPSRSTLKLVSLLLPNLTLLHSSPPLLPVHLTNSRTCRFSKINIFPVLLIVTHLQLLRSLRSLRLQTNCHSTINREFSLAFITQKGRTRSKKEAPKMAPKRAFANYPGAKEATNISYATEEGQNPVMRGLPLVIGAAMSVCSSPFSLCLKQMNSKLCHRYLQCHPKYRSATLLVRQCGLQQVERHRGPQ